MRRHLLRLLGLGPFMAGPGTGGLIPPPVNAPAGQAVGIGVQPGVQNGIFRRVTIIGSGGLVLVYSPAAAAGNLIESVAGAAGADQYGNNYVKGIAAYSNSLGLATILATSGAVVFATGSLSAGWVQAATISYSPAASQLVLSAANVSLNSSASEAIPTGNLSDWPIATGAVVATVVTACNQLYSALQSVGII
jgi:hypothetical protein